MLRNLAAALALVLMSQTALGLGLGTLKQSSALNEPFDGRVEILGVTATDLEGIRVRLADHAQFERANVQRDAILLLLRFKVVNSATGPDYVQITSREPIREPFLNFLLELNWANGRIVREYTVLRDPPLYDPARVRTAAPPVVAAPTPIPPPTAVTPSRPVIATPATAAPMASPAAVARSAPSSYSADSTLLVVANDTLWSIASANRPDDSTSVQQMMLAMLRANPEAFGDDNINILKRGAILRLPDESDTNVMSQAEAIAEVRRQHQLWNEYRDIATETVADAPLGEAPSIDEEPMDDGEPMADSEPMDDAEPMADSDPVADSEPTDDTEPAVDDGADARLELVASGDGDAMGAGTADDGAADITLAREELDAQVQENTELQARIAEANEIIDLMSRQVDIRDDELAALQARLLELGIEAPADSVAVAETPVDGETDAAADDAPMVDDPADSAVDMGDTDDEIPVAPGDIPDVDITIGDDPDMAPDASPPEDIAQDIDDSEIAMDEGGGTEPDTGGSLLGGLIPQQITNMVPGGAMTILGILGVVLLGAFAALFKLIGGRGDADSNATDAIASTADDDDPTALTEGFGDDEPITENRENAAEEFLSEDTTEVAPDVAAAMEETSPDVRTLESTAAELAAEEPEEDPLEEVNVYLAYERFDQAEELVRKVIADHPDEHKYKLRLLEVFYSSNNQAAYEEAARALHDGVGESDPLWESAVAMWTEMSPTRALFTAGAPAADEAPSAEQAPQQVVDITAEDEAGGNTMSMAPGSDSVLESTQVGLGPADDTDDQDPGSLDFDLGVDDGEAAGDDIFDLTATTDSLHKDDGILDLTAGADESVAAADSMSATQGDVLDVSATDELTNTDDDILDLTAPTPDGEHDLLDVTSTGMMTEDHPDELLNVTSPGLMGNDEPTADADLGASDDDGGGIDFDISDTVAPAFGADDEVADDDGDGTFDITSPSQADDDAPLDLDIGELEDSPIETDADDLTIDISGGLDFDSTSSEADGDIELEIAPEGSLDTPDSVDTVEMEAVAAPVDDISVDDISDDISEIDTVSLEESPASEDDDLEFDLSLQSSELDDLAIGGDTIGGPEGESDGESEIEFDLALEDTTEMDSLVIDETLELPKANTADESLEDLAKSKEERMADLDLGDDEVELDLSLADTSGGLDLDFSAPDDGSDAEASLDFDLEDLDLEDMDQADTIAMDLSGGLETTPDEEETEVLPVDGDVESQSEADEIDTKLNLAKAYIELGDNDGARSILDEVARDGSETQQSEAQRLIEQLT